MLTKGPAESCPANENVSVTIHGDVLTFTNAAVRNYAMGFAPQPDGNFTNSHVEIGGDIVSIRGRIEGGVLDANVTHPRASIPGSLKRSSAAGYRSQRIAALMTIAKGDQECPRGA